jgi:4-nitrophenyl phosphatase
MDDLTTTRAMIIDLDGVLWLGDMPLPGLDDFFALLRRRQIRFILVSNNATTTARTVQAKLRGMGVEVSPDEILTSSAATAVYLRDLFPQGARIYVVGEAPLKEALTSFGFLLADRAENVQVVIGSLDRQVTYEMLTEASLAIRAGALFLGTNGDVTYPTERGPAPGSGALLAALQAASGRAPKIVGKPEPYVYAQALARLGVSPEATLALGDRLETDILGGQRAGLKAAIVLTGVTRREDLANSPVRPDWVFEGLPDVCRALDGVSR